MFITLNSILRGSERNKLTTHFKKWEKLVAVMNTVISSWSSSLLINIYLFKFVFNFYVTCTVIKLL